MAFFPPSKTVKIAGENVEKGDLRYVVGVILMLLLRKTV